MTLLTANKIVGAPGTLAGISKNGYLVLAEDGYLLLESGERIILENNPLLLSFKSVGADGLLHRTHTIPLDPITQAIIDRMTTAGSTPSEKYQVAMDTMIKGWIADGDWQYFESAYIFEMEDEIQSLINWTTATFDPVKVGNPIFTAGEGWISDGAGYINLNFSPNDFVTISESDLMHFMYIAGSTTPSVQAMYGVSNGLVFDSLIPFHPTGPGRINPRIFSVGFLTDNINNLIPPGTQSNERQGTNIVMYTNGVQFSVDLQPVETWSGTQKYYALARNNNGVADFFSTDRGLGALIFAPSSLVNRVNMQARHDQFLIDIA